MLNLLIIWSSAAVILAVHIMSGFADYLSRKSFAFDCYITGPLAIFVLLTPLAFAMSLSYKP